MAEPSELDQMSNNARAKLKHRNIPKHIILHNSKFKATWDWFVLALVIYTAIEIPYTTAFGEARISPFIHLSRGEYLSIANSIVDLMFIVDILINFRSTYTRKGTDELVVDPRMIACNYLKSWFVIDLLAAIPFEFFVTEGTASLAGLLKSARLLRLVRVSRKLDRYSEYGLAVVVLLTCLFTLVAHWLACIWHWIGQTEKTYGYGWIKTLRRQMLTDKVFSNGTDASENENIPDVTSRYITSLYFTLTSLTSIGFGNVSPNTNYEKLFAVLMMLVGALMYAAIFGNMTAIIQRLYSRTARYHRDNKVIKEFIRLHNIPDAMQSTLSEYFTHEWSAQKDQRLDQVLQRFPESLQSDICVQIHREVFSRCPLFENMSESCIRALSIKFNIQNFLPSYFLIKEGDVMKYIYFFNLGTVDVIKGGGSISILGQGDCVGCDYSTKEAQGNIKADASLMARTFTEVHYVSWSDVFAVAQSFPELKELMTDYMYTMDLTKCIPKGGGLVGQGPWSALALGAPIGISHINIEMTPKEEKEDKKYKKENKKTKDEIPLLPMPSSRMNGNLGESISQSSTTLDKNSNWSISACQRIESMEKRLANVESKIEEILDLLLQRRAIQDLDSEVQHQMTYI